MSETSANELPRQLREFYEKGRAALDRQNLDYAITLFMQVLQKHPDCYECREALRATQLRKSGSGGGFFKRMLGTAGSSPLIAKAQLALRSNPRDAMHIAEQILNNDANNVLAHKILAEAATNEDMPKTAVLSLEIAFRNSPKDREIGTRLAEALIRVRQPARAETILTELAKLYPNDSDLAQALKDTTAKRHMTEGGYEAVESGRGSYRDILKDKDEAITLEQEARDHKPDEVADRLIREYEARLEKEPDNLKLLRSTAELCVQRHELERAIEYFKRIQSVSSGSDPSLDKRITEVQLRKLDIELAALDPSSEEFTRLKQQRDEFEVSEARRRVEQYPNDLQLRFDLGNVSLRLKRISEAIQEFQKSQANPHLKIASLNRLGQCFALRGMNDLASKTFQNAIREKLVFDEEKKDLIYRLGEVLEKMGRKEEAIEQWKLIYESDIGFRDVAAKVDAYYASQSG